MGLPYHDQSVLPDVHDLEQWHCPERPALRDLYLGGRQCRHGVR
jgi:hypothetical protein